MHVYCGHWAQQERPQEVNAIITRWNRLWRVTLFLLPPKLFVGVKFVWHLSICRIVFFCFRVCWLCALFVLLQNERSTGVLESGDTHQLRRHRPRLIQYQLLIVSVCDAVRAA